MLGPLGRYPRPAVLAEIPLDRHAVIEASAGTGKTFTIEHLVVDRLLRAECGLEELLVVTFTDKATSELRARIRVLIERVINAPRLDADALAELEAAREADDLDDPAAPLDAAPLDAAAAEALDPAHWYVDAERRRTLEEALFAFDRAPIHTIHAFCRRVLADMAFDSGQLFEMDRVDGHTAFRRAWRVTLRTELAREDGHRKTLEGWLRAGRDEVELERLLWDAHRKRYLEDSTPVEEELPGLMRAFENALDPGAILADLLGVAIQRRSLAAFESVLKRIEAALAETDDPRDRLEKLVSLDLDAVLHPRRTAVGQNKRRFPDGLAPETQRFLERLGRLRMMRGLIHSMERTIVDRFLPAVTARLGQQKRREGQFDYDDLLDRVWRALEGPDGEGLAENLRARFRYALIDEFQDTDDRQWAIFRRVFVDRPAGEPGALYIIGDPKQAIYSFRGADVHTYLAARANLLADPIRPAARVTLRTNYRSSGALIEGLNRVLDQYGRQPLFSGAIRYDAPVECGREALALQRADGGPAPAITLLRHVPARPRRRGERTLSAWPLMRAFAQALARQLSTLLTDEAAALTIVDGEGDSRRLTARDVYCLVRTGYEARDLEKALRAQGLACVVHQQEGLFATKEALDVRDVLSAVVDPHGRASRLRAMATPFFGVEWAVLSGYRDLPGDHPFVLRLFEWHRLAEQGRYAALFHAMLHDSGLVQRQLFLADDERRLTNYRHILEILLEECTHRRLTLTEAGALIDRYVAGQAEPSRSTAQRLADERDAVQIMTIHKSKGLEAGVVCLYGFLRESPLDRVGVVHDGEGRRVLVGEEARDAAARQLQQAATEEQQRLLYVALTRARVQLILPFVDSSRAIKGGYEALNRRLKAMYDDGALIAPIFGLEEAPEAKVRRRSIEPVVGPLNPLASWSPPTPLLSPEPPADPLDFERLRARHAPLLVTSYTRLKEEEARRQAIEPVDADEFKTDLSPEGPGAGALDEETLPGGRFMGRFLHEAIERLPFDTFAGRDFESWAALESVGEAFDWAMRRHEIDVRWRPTSQRVIFETLTRPVPLGEDGVIEGLWTTREQREMELLYPIPEADHPLLVGGGDPDGSWTADRGFIKGFVDIVFEHDGRVFWGDWKSDILPSYDPATIDAHVELHYGLQAQLYTLGLIRLLGIEDERAYDARFGGFIYVFLRGFADDGPPGTGLYVARPDWLDVVGWETALMHQIEPAEGRR